jgi:hypothetical protein
MKFEQVAIIRYEKARQLVAQLEDKRRKLIDECESIVTIEDGFFERETGEPCLVTAWKNFSDDDDYDSFGMRTGPNYDECLGEIGCKACIESFGIKNTTLSDAKKEFGIAKISLSALGKRLIKGVKA